MILPHLAGALSRLASPAFARAGGGGHYSGGGGSFGGGGGGGGGNYGWLLYLYIEFVMNNPALGVPATVALVVVGVLVYRQSDVMLVSDDRMHRTISDAAAAQGVSRRAQALAALRARDPGFSEEAFLARVKDAFLKVQAAWSAQDMAPARAFLSDGVMERFAIQLAMQKADGKRNPVDDARVLAASVVEVESDAHFDTLHVRVEASAVDREVSLADGRLLWGSESPREFVEVWSFLRRPGAKTLAKPGLVEGACPQCGAPLELADAARCPSCKCWVNSGEYDWVLAEITQESEWAVRGAGEAVPGFSALAAKDPGLNTQFLEDRASLAFWRWQWAFSRRDASALKAVATDACCQAVGTELSHEPHFFRDAAVGAVEAQAFETGDALDRAHVLVKWSGDRYEGEGAAARERGQVLRQHVFVLGRKAGVKTDARSGLRSAACPECGAPPSGPDQARCEYCGASFNDGSRSWVVLEVAPVGLWRLPEGLAAPGAPRVEEAPGRPLAPADVLALLVSAMAADGRLDEREQALLLSFARARAIPVAAVDAVVEAARENRLRVPTPADGAQAKECLRVLARMSLADGLVSDEEQRLMAAFAAPWGLDEGDVAAVVKRERVGMYRDAKAAVKAGVK